jgi:hypothetical protein
MKKLYITGDFNDADYGHYLVMINEETFEKFLPVIEAINNFEPYVRRSDFGGIDRCNWESTREDLGELPLEEKYSHIDRKLLEEFKEIFVDPIPVPEEGCDELGGPHTIVELVDVVTDEVLISTKDKYTRHTEKTKAYEEELQEIYSYKRKSDGKPLHSIPYKEMTEEENALIKRKNNLWKKYI